MTSDVHAHWRKGVARILAAIGVFIPIQDMRYLILGD